MKHNYQRIGTMLQYLNGYITRSEHKISDFSYKKTEYKKGNALPQVDESWSVFTENDIFTGYDEHAWFYKKVTIPESLRNKNLYLKFTTNVIGWDAVNPQFIVYINGKIVQGLDVNHTRVKIDSSMECFDLHLYAYTGCPDNGIIPKFYLASSLMDVDAVAEKVYYDIKVAQEILIYSEENTKEYFDLLRVVTETLNLLDFRKPHSEEYQIALQKASDYMDSELYGKLSKKSLPQVTCIGHTHIDIAWLWTVAQTREKAQRSFATVINLMRQYPDYKFMSSQAILYQMVKEEAPELYEEIKKAIHAGKWEVEGSMWVEADCNLISGESLVRQILVGKNFFKDEFDIDTKILWLPDVFGYSASMPQILKKAGVDKFVTSKISWNDTNQMPYDVFMWKGIDGTELFTYFLTAQNKVRGEKPVNYTTYVGMGEPKQVAGAWDRFQQKEIISEAIVTYGWGDGGGGPTSEHLEQIQRMSYGLPNCPTAVFDTATNFLNRVYDAAIDNRYFKKWEGELYLEFHRGTYTSQAKNKRFNRKAEFALSNLEALSIAGNVLTDYTYPKTTIDDSWKMVLTNQFHDIIPGSSIKEVYEVTDKEYGEFFQNCAQLQGEISDAIIKRMNTPEGLLVWNPNSYTHSGNVIVDGETYYVNDIPAKGYKVIPTCALNNAHSVQITDRKLENKYYTIEFDENYDITRLYSKKCNRELLQAGKKANVFSVFEDIPYNFDAWELSKYYKEKQWNVDELISVEPVFEGARAGFKIVKKFMTSTIAQIVYLYDETERIDFETDVDWDIEHTCLKVAFPVEINTSKATCDIQFGSIERNTHENTSWDAARFEICAHKYVDLSENGFGVTMMNDCKYGHDIRDGVMRLTLLKCATYPAPNADKGHHKFTYSIYAHEGSVHNSDAIELAYDLNNPMQACKVTENQGDLPSEYSLLSCDKKNFVVETIKQAEYTKDIIVRGYECQNKQTDVVLNLGFPVKKVYTCNLMEEKQEELTVENGKVAFTVKPFEIYSILIER